MRTTHRINLENASSMSGLETDSVDLVVTSPPYPMIEMWDDFFCEQSPDVTAALDDGADRGAFERMHEVLDPVWQEIDRVVKPSGMVCVNIGDATRKLGDTFRQFPNHVRVVDAFNRLEFDVLPDILWRKPTNSANKFMGSGMIPPNAYVTLEHEYILVFRQSGGPRTIQSDRTRRYESAYFWEERNDWFSDLWDDITGTFQDLLNPNLRDRAASFPVSIPYRLINMFSLQGDTVLDPFWGTGTTSLAAMMSARNSIGYELNPSFVDVFDEQLDTLPELTDRMNERRVERHRSYVEARDRDNFGYENEFYDTPVKTSQEEQLRFYGVNDCQKTGSTYTLSHEPWTNGSSQ